MAIPPKLAPGKSGRPVKLISNYFSVYVPAGEIYHYHLRIERISGNEEKWKIHDQIYNNAEWKMHQKYYEERRIKIVSTILNTDRYFKNIPAVYDGGENLYTRIALDIEHKLECQVVLGVEKYKVYINRVQKAEDNGFAIKLDSIHAFFSDEVSSVPQEAIQVFESALRIGPLLNYYPIKNYFFYPPKNTCPLGGATNIWTGYRQSLRLGQCQLLLNLDVKGSAFYQKRPLLDYFADFLNVSQLTNNVKITYDDRKKISQVLKGLKVTIEGRIKRILKLTGISAEVLNISGQNITVADHFSKRNNEPLKYPYLPCVELCYKNLICPLEVCEMIVQPAVRHLNNRQMSEMIKFTARSPKQRFENIIESLKMCNEFKDTYLEAFDIKVGNEPLTLDGRIIDAPKLSYQKEEAVKPKNGCWNTKNKQYFLASSVYSWIVVSFAKCKPVHLERFTKLLFDIATEHGMKMKPVKNILIVGKPERVKDILNEMYHNFKPDLMVVVLPGKDAKTYVEIKEFSETKPGLVTQCVRDTSVSKKCKPSVLGNLCQKINTKLGGINAILVTEELSFILQRPVIIIGASVSYQYSLNRYMSTVVGSLDAHLSRYGVKHSLQKYIREKQLRIWDIKSMMTNLLKAFHCNNRGKKPEKIIFFRAGICESQFEDIKYSEVRDIREACQSLDTTYRPGITYIVSQKRHHTRFVPQDCRNGAGRMGNIPAGTVVDSDVVRPSGFDFFLCSHFVTQGTSVPRHYTILEDDNHFTADELQKLTYYLCHTYAFSTKSLSCPAPIRYVQLAAQQIQQLLLFKFDELRRCDSEDKEQAIDEQLKNTMFFI